MQLDILLFRHLRSQLLQAAGHSVGHVGEAHTERVQIGACQRIFAAEVDEIADDHQRALAEVQIHTARRVGKNDGLHAQQLHHADGHGHLPLFVALVGMKASLHHADLFAVQRAAVPAARVPRRGGYREAGNILVGDALGVFQAFHIVAQTAAQHHADLRPAAGGFDRVGGSLQSLHIFFRGHFHFSFHFGEGDGETLPLRQGRYS